MGYLKQLVYSVSVFYSAFGNFSSSMFAILGFLREEAGKDTL